MSGLAAVAVLVTSQLVLLASGEAQSEQTSFALHRIDSTPHSLLVGWNVTVGGYRVSSSHIDITLKKKNRDVTMHVQVSASLSQYEVPDLTANSKYTVCLSAELTEMETSESAPHEQCVSMKTPPTIRADSILGLLAVIGYLLAMVLLGYSCWSRANSGSEEEEADEETGVSPIEEKIESNESQPFLLSAQPLGSRPPARPRSAIEDADIPYITPTWEQIAASEKTT